MSQANKGRILDQDGIILDAWGWCTPQREGMGREEGSGWGTQVYLWRIYFDIWQN